MMGKNSYRLEILCTVLLSLSQSMEMCKIHEHNDCWRIFFLNRCKVLGWDKWNYIRTQSTALFVKTIVWYNILDFRFHRMLSLQTTWRQCDARRRVWRTFIQLCCNISLEVISVVWYTAMAEKSFSKLDCQSLEHLRLLLWGPNLKDEVFMRWTQGL